VLPARPLPLAPRLQEQVLARPLLRLLHPLRPRRRLCALLRCACRKLLCPPPRPLQPLLRVVAGCNERCRNDNEFQTVRWSSHLPTPIHQKGHVTQHAYMYSLSKKLDWMGGRAATEPAPMPT
jgi:hypothetical protein